MSDDHNEAMRLAGELVAPIGTQTSYQTAHEAAALLRKQAADLKSARAETNRIIALLDAANDERKALRAEVERLRDEPNQWREAVGDELTILHASIPADPREAVKKLVALECQIALDPAVSEQAEALVQSGGADFLADWGIDVHDDEEGRTWLNVRNPDDDVARVSTPTFWPLNGNQTIGAVVLHQLASALAKARSQRSQS